ncbi:MAG: YggS family pyridoxal phosphate-dependent enzyme [Deltaproteobacteria bacterium]|nr:YggS family pyridoxal phosphate-dependent enzyme [Deltaproteobacteria bacterium]
MGHTIQRNVKEVLDRIRAAAERAGRSPDSVRLVGISKTVGPDAVRAAFEAGVRVFGENFIQEAREKTNVLSDLPVEWHFTGHLQTNKAKYAARMFHLIHTVDSLKLARELDKRANIEGKVQDVLVQVNVAGEAAKWGVDPAGAVELVREAARLPNMRIRGLMTMPPFSDDPEDSRPHFQALAKLAREIESLAIPGVSMAELSMGMTNDYEFAVEEGATLVRVGTALFGERR